MFGAQQSGTQRPRSQLLEPKWPASTEVKDLLFCRCILDRARESDRLSDRQSADSFYHHRPYCRMTSCTQMAYRVVPQCPIGPGTFPSLPTSPFLASEM